ncbi:MAG: hypothetical protein HYY96_10635 [Candidatus Tectomicrobia bacterium]|nr:hypothetical protein [Candidatus Tectomicrobia bacterium]
MPQPGAAPSLSCALRAAAPCQVSPPTRRPQRRRSRLRTLLLSAIASLLLPGLGWAAAPTRLSVHLGFQERFKLDSWVPVSVLVENSGPSLRGSLELLVHEGSRFRGTAFQARYVRRVLLPSGSRKRFAFTVYLDSFSEPLRVILRDEFGAVAEQAIDLRNHFTTSDLIVVLSDAVSADFLAQTTTARYLVTYPHLDRLPTDWYAFDGVAVVLVQQLPLQRLGRAQLEALERWVAQGGSLVIAGEVGAPPELPSAARWLPVEGLGVTQLEALPELARYFGQPLVAAQPFLVARAKLRSIVSPAEVLVAHRSLPILVRHPYLRGRIFFFALNLAQYPMTGWAGRGALWRLMLPAARAAQQRPETFALFERLFALPLRTSASILWLHLLILAVVLPYLGLLTGIYWFLHRSEAYLPARQRGTFRNPPPTVVWRPIRPAGPDSGGAATALLSLLARRLGPRAWPRQPRRAAFWLAAAAPVGFTFVALLLLGNPLQRDQVLAFDVRTLEVAPRQPLALLEGHWGLFATRRTTIQIRSTAANAALRQLAPPAKRQAFLDVHYLGEEGARLLSIPAARWSQRSFTIATQVPARLEVDAWVEGPLLRLQVRNSLGMALRSPFAIAMGGLLSLPTLEPGEEAARSLPLFQEEVPDEALQRLWDALFFRRDELASPSEEELIKRSLMEVLFPLSRLRKSEQENELLLLGWLPPQPPSFELIHEGALVRRATLLIARVPMRGFQRTLPAMEGF